MALILSDSFKVIEKAFSRIQSINQQTDRYTTMDKTCVPPSSGDSCIACVFCFLYEAGGGLLES